MKRAIDVVVALGALLLLSPLLLIVALLVARYLGRPVLFRQVRPGLGAKNFELLKFRTMTDSCDERGALLPDEQRLTTFGRILRSTSLDELPQFYNILRGNLSLVGPRPLLVKYLPYYTPHEARRHDVRPGITGWAQVNGRNSLSWDTKLAMDVWYVDHYSLSLDLRILLKTVAIVLRRSGTNEEGSATMTELSAVRQPYHRALDEA